MRNNLYHQVDPATGEILGMTLGRWRLEEFTYLREQDDDWRFFNSWNKVWPGIKPLISELKLFRKWIKADRAFRTVGNRPELSRGTAVNCNTRCK